MGADPALCAYPIPEQQQRRTDLPLPCHPLRHCSHRDPDGILGPIWFFPAAPCPLRCAAGKKDPPVFAGRLSVCHPSRPAAPERGAAFVLHHPDPLYRVLSCLELCHPVRSAGIPAEGPAGKTGHASLGSSGASGDPEPLFLLDKDITLFYAGGQKCGAERPRELPLFSATSGTAFLPDGPLGAWGISGCRSSRPVRHRPAVCPCAGGRDAQLLRDACFVPCHATGGNALLGLL